MLNIADLVHTESSHPAHANIHKTLTLLKIESKNGPIFFVIQSSATLEHDDATFQSQRRYFYEEHTCPTNIIDIPMISRKGDHDPHGCFEHVRSVWMPKTYEEAERTDEENILLELFPELTQK